MPALKFIKTSIVEIAYQDDGLATMLGMKAMEDLSGKMFKDTSELPIV
jgi:hypothetical protein